MVKDVLHVVDVGAARSNPPAPYLSMLHRGLCRVTGFEPRQVALDELNAHKGPLEIYRPEAVLDGKEHVLWQTAAGKMTSLRVPDPYNAGMFGNFDRWSKIVAGDKIDTVTLDDALAGDWPDFIKMDTQGTELAILKHAPKSVEHAIAIQLEVSFVPIYVDQPPFGEVDLWLREQGFMPHKMSEMVQSPLLPGTSQTHQVLEADFIYIRNVHSPRCLSVEQWQRMEILAEHVFVSDDLAARCRAMLKEKEGMDAAA